LIGCTYESFPVFRSKHAISNLLFQIVTSIISNNTTQPSHHKIRITIITISISNIEHELNRIVHYLVLEFKLNSVRFFELCLRLQRFWIFRLCSSVR
jgi:hypothetical protein